MSYNIFQVNIPPEKWILAKLGDVIDFKGGSQPPKSVFSSKNLDGYIRLIQIRDFKTDRYKTYIPYEHAKRFFNEDDVMIARYGPPLFQILRGLSGTYNVALMKATPTEKVNKEFLFYLLQEPQLQNFVIENSQRTAGQTGVNLELLNNIIIPLPPMDVQKKIATILDKADHLRRKRREALEKLDRLVQSVFLDMFGDPVSNPKGWEVFSVNDFVDSFETGRSIATTESDENICKFKIIKVSAVTWGYFDGTQTKPLPLDYQLCSEHLIHKDDLLFSRANTRELVGATAYVFDEPHNLILPDKIWRFKWKEPTIVAPLYIWYLFQQGSIRYKMGQLATGTSGSMKNISQEKVMSMKVPLPPLNIQKRFSEFISKIRFIKDKHIISQQKTNKLFNSLIQKAFRGELKFNDGAFEELKETIT